MIKKHLIFFVLFCLGVLILIGAYSNPQVAIANQVAPNNPSGSAPIAVLRIGNQNNPHPAHIPAPEYVLNGTAATNATIHVVYNGNWSSDQTAAFEYAKHIWETEISSTITIEVAASWVSLGPGILAQCGATGVMRDFPGAPISATWYVNALANKLAGKDLNTSLHDIEMDFNSDYASEYYFGTDGNPPSDKFDYVTAVIHEMGHGLGVASSMVSADTGKVGSWGFINGKGGSYPFVYDYFVYNGFHQRLMDTAVYPNGSNPLGNQLVSNNIYFVGPHAMANNDNLPPKLYAPSPWEPGSSISHLDELTYSSTGENSIMTPKLDFGESIHSLGPILRGMLEDLGWKRQPALVLSNKLYLSQAERDDSTIYNGIYGKVTQNGIAANGIQLNLRFFHGTAWTSILTTTTDLAGYYSFPHPPTLGLNQRYYVRFVNTTLKPGRLWLWSTPYISDYIANVMVVPEPTFDIGDIPLIAPRSSITTKLPLTFQWKVRPATHLDSYSFNLYKTGGPYWSTNPYLGYVDVYTLTQLPTDPNTQTPFGFNTQYTWEVWAYSPTGGYGISLNAEKVTFTNAGKFPSGGVPASITGSESPVWEDIPPRP